MTDQNTNTTKRSHTDEEDNNHTISYNVKDENEDSFELSSKKMKLEHNVTDGVGVGLVTETTATTLDGFHVPNNVQPLETTSISNSNDNKNLEKNDEKVSDEILHQERSSASVSTTLPTTTTTPSTKTNKRWRAHVLMEYYTEAVGHLMMPTNSGDGKVNPYWDGLERITTLGYLTSPLRQRTVWEDWSPREVALFEAALMQYGKDFSRIAHKHLVNKQTKDVVAFYYIWKKTKHYKEWKRQYQPDDDIGSSWILDTHEVSAHANGGKPR
ncbi:hypothetical protein MHU86_20052 [Fragilaria crotonensis]|nr:hypothetical protein MHU86_20052 [Fragilaria crotonensis]